MIGKARQRGDLHQLLAASLVHPQRAADVRRGDRRNLRAPIAVQIHDAHGVQPAVGRAHSRGFRADDQPVWPHPNHHQPRAISAPAHDGQHLGRLPGRQPDQPRREVFKHLVVGQLQRQLAPRTGRDAQASVFMRRAQSEVTVASHRGGVLGAGDRLGVGGGHGGEREGQAKG